MMTRKKLVFDMLIRSSHITAAEIQDQSKHIKLRIINPSSVISQLRRAGVPVKSYLEDNVHNTAKHACWYLKVEWVKRYCLGKEKVNV